MNDLHQIIDDAVTQATSGVHSGRGDTVAALSVFFNAIIGDPRTTQPLREVADLLDSHLPELE